MTKTKISPAEAAYNNWWMSRFDAKNYKMISLYSYGKKLHEYTTANSRYSDMEDVESAVFTAKRAGIRIDQVGIDGKMYKVSHKMYERIGARL